MKLHNILRYPKMPNIAVCQNMSRRFRCIY